MTKRKVYQIEGKTPDEVKASFIYYMGDRNATSKQIKDAANSRYAKIDSIDTVCNIVKRLYDARNIFQLTDFGQVQRVSDTLTEIIAKRDGDVKELKNQRSYVNKYRDFLKYCADQMDKSSDTSAEYNFGRSLILPWMPPL